ncbi:MAG: DUF2325 domain-containing protein [Firmicutes bacterium]|nr:DUF2325 domain-containing protein [Bacillota bacterium]
MSLMIIGADNLGSIEENVRDIGFTEIIHLSGRSKSAFRNFQLPVDIDMVLVLTDYIHHTAMKKVKREAKDKNVDVIYARRSWAAIYKKLERRQMFNCI